MHSKIKSKATSGDLMKVHRSVEESNRSRLETGCGSGSKGKSRSKGRGLREAGIGPTQLVV